MDCSFRLYDLVVKEKQAIERDSTWYGTMTALGQNQDVLAWYIAIPRMGINELYQVPEHSIEDVHRRVEEILSEVDT